MKLIKKINDIPKILNINKNDNTIFYHNNDEKIETSYKKETKIIKYKNGKIDRFPNDNKENINCNIISQNSLNNKTNYII